jgi:hypothetical protein
MTDEDIISKAAIEIRDAIGKSLEQLRPALREKYKCEDNVLNTAVAYGSIHVGVLYGTACFNFSEETQDRIAIELLNHFLTTIKRTE